MSDMSFRWCKTCKQPEYACDCEDEEDFEEMSPVQKVLAKVPRGQIWEEDCFYGRKLPPKA